MDDTKKRTRDEAADAPEVPTAKKPSISEARQKALAIAAKIGGNIPLGTSNVDQTQNFGMGMNNMSGNPAGYNPNLGTKFEKIVYIPQKDYPNTNFVGLLLGPKASTKRKMEEETGTSITIRGKSISNSNFNASHNVGGDDEDLHAYIVANTEENAAKAEKMISEIVNSPEKMAELKQSQMNHLDGLNAMSHMNPGNNMGGMNMGSLGPSVTMGNPAGVVTRVVKVPGDLAGAIIGRQGDQIRQFQLASGAHIQIDNRPEAMGQPIRDVTVQGTLPQVDKAEEMIMEFVRRKKGQETGGGGGSYGSGAGNFANVIKLEVPNDKVGLVIGKQGKTVQRIQMQFRCKVDIPVAADEDNPQVRTLTIGANSNPELEAAKNEILGVINYLVPQNMNAFNNYGPSNMGMGNMGMNNMGSMGGMGSYMGMGNNQSYGYGNNYGATGNYGNYGSYSNQGTAYGYQMGNAQNSMQGTGMNQMGLNNANVPANLTQNLTMETVNLVVPEESVSSIIGVNSATIQDVQSRTNCRVSIPQNPDVNSNPPTRTISITGRSDQIQLAVQQITSIVSKTSANTTQSAEQTADASGQQDVGNLATGTDQSDTGNTSSEPVQKYTKKQWAEWVAYYKQMGYAMEEECPANLRADNFE